MEFTPYRTTGTIISVKPFGALVELEGTKEIGLLHISKVSERFVSDIEKHLVPGEQIRVDVTNKTEERIELSIIDIPHYRNIDTPRSEEFEHLAEKLPGWIKDYNKKEEK